jgi:acetyl esterase/lipase
MALKIDPQVLDGLSRFASAEAVTPPVGDVATRRVNSAELFERLAQTRTPTPGIERTDYTATAHDGAEIGLAWFAGASPSGAAVVYLHGGGMILPMLPVYDPAMRAYAAASGVSMLLVDYRVAPEHPHPTPVEDCYTGLVWLAEHCEELGIDPARIAVMGDSAGGGLAAGVALLARDRGGPALAQQILIYPMLDDRTVEPDPQLPPEYLVWNYDDNRTGWGALLGDAAGGSDVSPYAAPARATDLAGLPDTFIDVGDLDIFRNEDIDYARRLIDAGVPTELHVLPGCPHAFEAFAAEAAVSQRVIADRLRRLTSL